MINELIPYHDFSQIRLAHYLGWNLWQRLSLRKLDNWEFMDCIWIGEGLGFTEFLRLKSRPNELGSISIDLDTLSIKQAEQILNHVNLPLKKSMTELDVFNLIGEPESEESFVNDRKTYNFSIGQKWPYHVDCTIHETEGLIYIVIIKKDLLPKKT